MFWKICWGFIFLSNTITLIAIEFFGFMPTPKQVAATAFFAAGTACLPMFNQRYWNNASSASKRR